jgi:prepilin-type N-terminal cleavage/methylation domain-containing protein
MNQTGLTIVELLVVISVSSILMTVVTAFALQYWGNTTALSTAQGSLVSRLNASDFLANSINQASGLIRQNDLPDQHPGVVDTSNSAGTYWEVIHAVPGSITMGPSGTIKPLLYYNRPSVNDAKNIILNGTQAYQDDVILYLDGTTNQLLARTIANGNATSNRLRTTCPPAVATTSCPADTVVSDDVSSVNMRYFSRSGNLIDYTSITDPTSGGYIGPDFPSVEIVEFTINLSHKTQLHSATTITNQTVVRVALRN